MKVLTVLSATIQYQESGDWREVSNMKKQNSRICFLAPILVVLVISMILFPHKDGLSKPVTLPTGEVFADEALVEAANKEGKLVHYTAQGATHVTKHVKNFNRRFPSIKVEIVRLVTGRLHERVLTENAAGKLMADTITYTDFTVMDDLYDRGMLAKHLPPSDSKYDDAVKRRGYWYPVIRGTMGVVYNTDLVKEPLKSWKDILRPEWKGMVGTNYPGAGGAAYTQAYFVRKKFGVDYWKRLAALKPNIETGFSAQINRVISGELMAALMVDTVGFPKERSGAPVKLVFPAEGVPSAPYAIALVKGCRHPNAAKLFYQWVLSSEGQASITEIRGAYSARPDVPEPRGKIPMNQVNFFPLDRDDFKRVRADWIKEWVEIFDYR